MTEEPEEEEEEVEEVEEVDDDSVVMVAAVIDPAAVAVVEQALHHATHLRPLWERLLVGEESEGRTILGMPLSNKVTSDSIDNHSRHLFSLFNLLGVPLVSSPMMLERFDISREALRSLNGPVARSDKKKAAEAAAAAAAAEAGADGNSDSIEETLAEG